MATTCFYFDGFKLSDLEKRPNAFSAWLETTSDLSEVVINGRINKKDSLESRWLRVTNWVDWLSESQDITIRILGYSMGCHLAVKFAAALASTKRVRELWLIAPDPKFRWNPFDVLESLSAYKEAQELWGNYHPGERFSSTLKHLSKSVEQKIQIIYAKSDTVALWEKNVKRMRKKCSGEKFQWHPITIKPTDKIGGVRFNLKPDEASNEFWIHQQLFTMASRR